MNTTNITVLTAVTVVAGRWSQGKTFDAKVVIGAVVITVLLFVGSTVAPSVAEPLAWLAFVAALLNYGPDIFKNLGGK